MVTALTWCLAVGYVLRMWEPPAMKAFKMETPPFPGRLQWREREREKEEHTANSAVTQDHCLQPVSMEDIHGFSTAMSDSERVI